MIYNDLARKNIGAAWTILVALLVAVMLTTALRAADSTTVQTSSGPVVGKKQGPLHVYKGIPYVAAPVAELRWKTARPHARWETPLKAYDYGPSCLQPKLKPRAIVKDMSEDCLTLNIWAPANKNKARPVMVWIHGGAFLVGSSSRDIYDGSQLAKAGVVFVSLNYRLGRFGFFAHPALRDAEEKSTANFGLTDQIDALEWIQENIARFGGDPSNITVFGESAGGKSITHLLTAEASRGLFQKAIVQSGGGYDRMVNAWENTDFLASMEGLAQEWIGQKDARLTLADLQTIPADKIMQSWAVSSQARPGPMVDGVLLTENVAEAFKNGGVAVSVPLLIGSNSYEASLMEALKVSPAAVLSQAKGYEKDLKKVYGTAATDTALAQYLYRDGGFSAPARFIAGQSAKSGSKAWLYYFDHVPKFRRGKAPGAAHGLEIPYVFKTLDKLRGSRFLFDAPDHALSEVMQQVWVSFAKNGKPQLPNGPVWHDVQASNATLVIRNKGLSVEAEFRKNQLDLIDTIIVDRAKMAAKAMHGKS